MKKAFYIISGIVAVLVLAVFLSRKEADPVEKPVVSQPPAVKETRKKQGPPPIVLPELLLEMPAVEDLNEKVAQVVGFDDSLNLTQRSQMLRQLRNQKLTTEDFRAIMTFLKENPKGDGPQLAWHSLKNDLLIFLIEDGRFKETTGKLMVDLIEDISQHEVMREYTLQYTTAYFERHWLDKSNPARRENHNLSDVDLELQNKMLTTMWSVLDPSNGSIAGTALMRLNDLSKTFQVVDQARLEENVVAMVKDVGGREAARMAALSVAAERQMNFLKDTILEITFDSEQSTSLRMSALHTASCMNPDKDFIEQLKAKIINSLGADKRLKIAARIAIKKYQKRRG